MTKLKKLCDKYSRWDEILDVALYCYRVPPSNLSKVSPFYLIYGRHPNVFVDEDKFTEENYMFLDHDVLLRKRDENFRDCKGIIQKTICSKNLTIDKKNSYKHSVDDLKIGDLVLKKNRGKKHKLDDSFIGLFEIVSHQVG